jgi:uncharacterized membrane protein YjfL (UPF0719 family)
MSWLRHLSRLPRLLLSLVLITGLLSGPFVQVVQAGENSTDVAVEIYDSTGDGSTDVAVEMHESSEDQIYCIQAPCGPFGEDEDEDSPSKPAAMAKAGVAAMGVALSGVALSYLLPMALGPISWVPTALIWGSAAIAAPLFAYMYNDLLERDFSEHRGLGLLMMAGLGLAGAAAAAALFPAAGILAGIVGSAIGMGVGLPLFQSFAVEDEDGPNLDDDDLPSIDVDDDDDVAASDDPDPQDDEVLGEDDYEALWDQYQNLEELYERVEEAYRRFMWASNHGEDRAARTWLRRYRRLERIYRDQRGDYETDREDLGY